MTLILLQPLTHQSLLIQADVDANEAAADTAIAAVQSNLDAVNQSLTISIGTVTNRC